MRRIFHITLLLSVLGILPAFPQSPSPGAQLRGTILDPNSAVVAGETVTLRSDSTLVEQSTTADASGQYAFLLVPAGQYTLTVAAAGFSKLTDTGVTLTVGQLAKLPLTLQLASVTAEVSVTSDAQLVETSRISVATTVDQIRIDNLPINGRNYINFTLTNSQVARDTAPSIGAAPTSGLNVGGQRARANLVSVDGADAVDNSVNGVRATVSQEAVQEFQVITSNYMPEYGRAMGGVVNIVTKSGGNDVHGNVFGYLRDSAIQAQNPFSVKVIPNAQTGFQAVPVKPPYTRAQAGATLGGPIYKDKTFFFFAYEITRRQETGFSSIGANNFGLVNTP